MKFSKEFLNNEFFHNQALGFHEPLEGTKAVLLPDGSYDFQVYAPAAEDVRLILGWNDKPLILNKDKEGNFTGRYPYNARLTGQVGFTILIDGAAFLSPHMPIFWTSDRPCNYIEVPDKEMDFAMFKKVPHGSYSREVYWADNFSRHERCFVYTPPGYMNSDKKYPVLYLLHGGTDNEISWEYGAGISQIMDNLIAAGECTEFIVVMNNGMLRYEENKNNKKWDLALEDMLTGSCIPHIERTYRVKTGKWNRAIGGLSMGAYQTNDIGFRHPELFGYMGQFTASITHEEAVRTYQRAYKERLIDKGEFVENYKVYWRSTTPNEDHFDYFEADDGLYEAAGITGLPCYHRNVYPDGTSRWKSWRMGIRDYAKLIFK